MRARHASFLAVLFPLGCAQIIGLDTFTDQGGAGGGCDALACLESCGAQGKVGACEGGACVCHDVGGAGGGGTGGTGGSGPAYDCSFSGPEFAVFTAADLGGYDLIGGGALRVLVSDDKVQVAALGYAAGGARVFARTVSSASEMSNIAKYPDTDLQGPSPHLFDGVNLPGRVAFGFSSLSTGLGQIEFSSNMGHIQSINGSFVTYTGPGCGNFPIANMIPSVYQGDVYYAATCQNEFDPWHLYFGKQSFGSADVHADIQGANGDTSLTLAGYVFDGVHRSVSAGDDGPGPPIVYREGVDETTLGATTQVEFEAGKASYVFGLLPRLETQGPGVFVMGASLDIANVVPAKVWSGSMPTSDLLAFAGSPSTYLQAGLTIQYLEELGAIRPAVTHGSYVAASVAGEVVGDANRKVVAYWWGPDGDFRFGPLVAADYAGVSGVPETAYAGPGSGFSNLVIWSVEDGGTWQVLARNFVCSAVNGV